MKIAEYKKKYGGCPQLISAGAMMTKVRLCVQTKGVYFKPWHKYPVGKTPYDENGCPVQCLTMRAYIWEDEGTIIRDQFDFLILRDSGELYRKLKASLEDR